MVFMFEKLQVYQKAVDFADEVTCASETFPTHPANEYLWFGFLPRRGPGVWTFFGLCPEGAK